MDYAWWVSFLNGFMFGLAASMGVSMLGQWLGRKDVRR